jgi:hypothetical protein
MENHKIGLQTRFWKSHIVLFKYFFNMVAIVLMFKRGFVQSWI